MFLSRSPLLGAGGPADALLSLEEPEALQAAMNALEPEEAALAIGQASTLDEKSRLIWALAPARRRAALDELHPGLVGALIQNREAENKALLGDLSREQFARLLHYCSPEQAYYWLALAASLENPRANMLPLLVPIEELAGALLTRPQFVLHCQEVGNYSVGDFHLDLQDELLDIVSATVTVYGPEGAVIEEFPILDDLPARDPRLRRLLHTLEHHPDHYRATVTVISTEGDLEEIPLRDPRLRRLLHKLLDYDLEQYSALLNLFGPEGVLREFPIRDRRLRRLVKRILDHDPEQYIALIQAALELYDYEGGHPEEREILYEAPVVMNELLTVDEERARAGLARPDAPAAEIPGRAPEPAPPSGPAVESDRGEEMTFLTRSPLGGSDSPAQALLSLEEPAALQAAINALDPEDAALAIGQAPSLEEKSRLVWALQPGRRAEVLDQLHPGFIGTLIQNREAENKALLGDLSREQFTRLLRYCSPERAYYWLTLATSFEDARANLLPLLVPITDLAAALLTQPEFETHCQQIGDYSVEGLGLDLAEYLARAINEFRDLAFAIVTVFGADGMLREFPIRDRRLRQICQTILDLDPEHYVELIHVALRLSDYAGNNPEENEVLREEPIFLERLLTTDEERARVGLTAVEERTERPAAAEIGSVPSLPARQSAELMRTAAAALPAQRQSELSQEMQLLFLQEAAYAGGSFAQEDLERAAERVQSYVQLGLAGLSEGDTGQAAQLLGEQRLRTLMESGARQVERLRQVALRLQPWHEVLDKDQIRMLEGIVHPDLGIEGESDRPVLRLRKAPHAAVIEAIDLETARTRLEAIDTWIALVRAVGKARITRRTPDAGTGTLTRALIVAAVLYRLWDPALAEPADLARFRQTYLDTTTGRWNQAAYRALAEALQTLAADRKLEPAAVQKIARLLARALDDMAAAPV
jgi:uncharacterized protein DUF6178